MKKVIHIPYSSTEWLYAPGFIYHTYEKEGSRELGLIFPYEREWKTNQKFPLVVFIPGAAWHRQELYNDVPKFVPLATKGCVFAILQVRESDLAPFPAQIEDVHRAITWLIENSQRFHIDTEQIFLAGNSSGGHLALISAFTKMNGVYIPKDVIDYTLKGVIAQAASSDITMCLKSDWPASLGKRPSTCLMGANTDEECAKIAHSADCITYVSEKIPLPPVLMFHFSDDPVVDCQMSRDLYERLIETRHKADYYELVGNEHCGNGIWNDQTIEIIAQFIFQK